MTASTIALDHPNPRGRVSGRPKTPSKARRVGCHKLRQSMNLAARRAYTMAKDDLRGPAGRTSFRFRYGRAKQIDRSVLNVP